MAFNALNNNSFSRLLAELTTCLLQFSPKVVLKNTHILDILIVSDNDYMHLDKHSYICSSFK